MGDVRELINKLHQMTTENGCSTKEAVTAARIAARLNERYCPSPADVAVTVEAGVKAAECAELVKSFARPSWYPPGWWPRSGRNAVLHRWRVS